MEDPNLLQSIATIVCFGFVSWCLGKAFNVSLPAWACLGVGAVVLVTGTYQWAFVLEAWVSQITDISVTVAP